MDIFIFGKFSLDFYCGFVPISHVGTWLRTSGLTCSEYIDHKTWKKKKNNNNYKNLYHSNRYSLNALTYFSYSHISRILILMHYLRKYSMFNVFVLICIRLKIKFKCISFKTTYPNIDISLLVYWCFVLSVGKHTVFNRFLEIFA